MRVPNVEHAAQELAALPNHLRLIQDVQDLLISRYVHSLCRFHHPFHIFFGDFFVLNGHHAI